MITMFQLKLLAANTGYEGPKDCAQDNDLARCDTCLRWGKWGEDVLGNGKDQYCEAHRPKSETEANGVTA